MLRSSMYNIQQAIMNNNTMASGDDESATRARGLTLAAAATTTYPSHFINPTPTMERQSKRQKRTVASASSNMHRMIQSKNNQGVEYMNAEACEEASRCFRQSIDILVNSHREEISSGIPASLSTMDRCDDILDQSLESTTTTTTTTGSRSSRSSGSSSSSSRSADDHECSNSSNDSKCTPTAVAVYDEGMNCFTQSIRIDDPYNETPVTTLLAIIYYNIGQLYLRLLNGDNQAFQFFCKSHDLLLQEVARQQSSHHRDEKQHQEPNCNKSSLDLLVCVLHNIAYIYYRRGKLEVAAQMLERALNYLLPNRTKYALELASTMNCLGVVYFHMSSVSSSSINGSMFRKAAVCMCEQSLTIQRSYHGEPCYETRQLATVLNNLGRIYISMNDNTKAIANYTEALNMRRRALGNDHIDVAATLYNMGRAHQEQKDFTKALDVYNESLNIVKLLLGRNHRDVAIMLKCIAQIYHEQNRNDISKETYEEALNIARVALGEYHVEVAVILNKYGNMLFEIQHYDDAHRIYKEGLHVERKVLEPTNPNIAITLINIARIYKQNEMFEEALELYEEAASIQRKTLGPSHPEVATTVSLMGLIYYLKSDCTKSIVCYQEALRIRWLLYGETSNLEIASTLNSIGLVLFRLRATDLALRSFLRCYEMRLELLGSSNHRDVGIVLFNIATAHLELGNEEQALRLYKETIRVESSVLGKSSKEVVFTMRQVALLHQDRGEYSEAIDCFRRALAIQQTTTTEHCDGDEGSRVSIINTLTLLGNAYLQQGDITNAIAVYSEALRFLEAAEEGGEDGSSSSSLVVDLSINGMTLYGFNKLHPKCAAAA